MLPTGGWRFAVRQGPEHLIESLPKRVRASYGGSGAAGMLAGQLAQLGRCSIGQYPDALGPDEKARVLSYVVEAQRTQGIVHRVREVERYVPRDNRQRPDAGRESDG